MNEKERKNKRQTKRRRINKNTTRNEANPNEYNGMYICIWCGWNMCRSFRQYHKFRFNIFSNKILCIRYSLFIRTQETERRQRQRKREIASEWARAKGRKYVTIGRVWVKRESHFASIKRVRAEFHHNDDDDDQEYQSNVQLAETSISSVFTDSW